MPLRFSHDLERLLERLAVQPLTIANLLTESPDRGFHLAIGLLVLPLLLPVPPGATNILGAGCLLLALQLAIGRQTPWLPNAIGRVRFPVLLSHRLLQLLQRLTGVLERWVKPRWCGIANHPVTQRLNGLCIAWLTLLLMLPVPLTNPPLTLAILLLVIAGLEADGLLLCVGYAAASAMTIFFALLFYGLWRSAALLQPGF